MSRPEAADHDAKPFLEHLEDLRRTIIYSLLALAVGVCVALPATPWIVGILKRPLLGVVDDPERFLQSLEVAGAFTIALRTSLWAGTLLSAPFILFFIGQFVFPGLTEREKAVVKRCAGVAIGLFFVGVWFGYVLTLKVALQVMFGLHEWLGIQAAWRITDYIGFTLHLLIAFGLAFEMPVVLVVLGYLGVVSSTQLREKRRHMVIVILTVAMFLTPPDPFTQIAMAIPLYVLYELCIWVIRAFERKSNHEL